MRKSALRMRRLMTSIRAGVTCCVRAHPSVSPTPIHIRSDPTPSLCTETPQFDLIPGTAVFLTPVSCFSAGVTSCCGGSITCGSEVSMMKMEELPDFKDVEIKLGRKVPESLTRSCTGETAIRCSETHARADDLHTLNNKIRFLRQQMAHLRSIDVKLMHQLLSINEGVESMRWLMEERGGVASRDGSLTGSSFSLSDSQSQHDSDGLDGISVGSYLDTLGEDDPDPDGSVTEETFTKSALRPRVESDEYYCFG